MLKFKKIGALVLAAGMIMSTMTACGSKSSTSSSSTQTSSNETVEITQLVWDRGQIPSAEGTLEDNWFTKEVNKRIAKLGLKVKYVPVPNGQREQKLATLLASSEAPDLCYTYDQSVMQNYSRNGGLVDFSSYLDKYGSNIKKTISADQLTKSKIDGKLTRIFGNAFCTTDTTFVRQDWLDKLGMKAPTNVDEFYAYLKAVKEKDPGKVGDKLVPFLMENVKDQVLQRVDCDVLPGFLKEAPTGQKLVTPYQLWPETKEMYRFLNKLYNEKLTTFLFTDNDSSQYRQKVMKGEVGATTDFGTEMVSGSFGNLSENLAKNIPGAKFAYTYPWKDSAAKNQIYQIFNGGVGGYMAFFIPKTAKNPAAVVKYLNYMASNDYTTLVNKGIENVDFKMQDGMPVNIDDAKFKSHVAWVAPAYQTFDQMFSNEPKKMVEVNAQQYILPYRNDFINGIKYGDVCTKYGTPIINYATPESSKYSANLKTQWNNSAAKFLTASTKDFDKIYDDAVASFKSQGGDAVSKEAVDLYNKQYNNK